MATVELTRLAEIAKGYKVNASPVVTSFNEITDQLNGGIDSENIGTGKVTTSCIADGGVTAIKIATGTITDTQIATGAAIDTSKLGGLASAKIIVGNAAGLAAAVTMSGDATISNTGALTIAPGAVETAMLADDAATTDKIATGGVQGYAGTSEDDTTHSTTRGNIYYRTIGANDIATCAVNERCLDADAVVNSKVSSSAAISPSKIDFSDSWENTTPDVSLWGGWGYADPKGLTITATTDWTNLSIDTYLPTNCTAPSGENILAVVHIYLVAIGTPTEGGNYICLRPYGSSWTLGGAYVPAARLYTMNETHAYVSNQCSTGTFLIRANTTHLIQYGASLKTNVTGYLSILGYIPIVPK